MFSFKDTNVLLSPTDGMDAVVGEESVVVVRNRTGKSDFRSLATYIHNMIWSRRITSRSIVWFKTVHYSFSDISIYALGEEKVTK